jgi:hypothetical protein
METNIPGCPKNLLIATMVLMSISIGMQLYSNHQRRVTQNLRDNE